jgi:hypothetical protein
VGHDLGTVGWQQSAPGYVRAYDEAPDGDVGSAPKAVGPAQQPAHIYVASSPQLGHGYVAPIPQTAAGYVGPSQQPVNVYVSPSQQPANRFTRSISDSFLVRCGKSILGTALAMFIVADAGVNLAHNAGAVVSRVVPVMDDRPFYFDPLAIVHDLERVIR